MLALAAGAQSSADSTGRLRWGASDLAASTGLRIAGEGPEASLLIPSRGIDAQPAELEGLVLQPEMELRGRLIGSGRLVLTVGSDPTRVRGARVSLSLDPPGLTLAPLLTARLGQGSGGTGGCAGKEFRLQIRRRGMALEIDGERVRPPHSGAWSLDLTAGRLSLGAEGGDLRWEAAELDARLTRHAAARGRRRAQSVAIELPRQRPISWAGPLDRVRWDAPPSAFSAADRAQLQEVRSRFAAGRLREALGQARKLRDRRPEAALSWFLVGALELELGFWPGEAARSLAAARSRDPDWPGAALLEGDALLMLGRLDAAVAAFAAEPDEKLRAGGLALVAWAKGDARRARELIAGSSGRSSRRAGLRLRLLDEVLGLDAGEVGLAGVEAGSIRVWSDLDKKAARRIANWVEPFLRAARATLGIRAEEGGPLIVLALSRPAYFDLFNARLGGIRLADTDGIYYPAARTLVLRDDDDPSVARPRLQHELVHHLAQTQGWSLPALLEEGVADWMATATPKGTRLAGLGQPLLGRLIHAHVLMEEGGLRDPIEVLTGRVRFEGQRGRADYAEAWAAVHTLAATSDTLLANLLQKGTGQLSPADWKVLLAPHLSGAGVRAHLQKLLAEQR